MRLRSCVVPPSESRLSECGGEHGQVVDVTTRLNSASAQSSAPREEQTQMRTISTVACRVLVRAAIVLCFGADATRAEILLGVAGPLTGPNAWGGELTQQGFGLALADLNAAGGVLGQQIRGVAV